MSSSIECNYLRTVPSMTISPTATCAATGASSCAILIRQMASRGARVACDRQGCNGAARLRVANGVRQRHRFGPQIDCTLSACTGQSRHEQRRCKKALPADQHKWRRQVIRAHKRGRTKTQIADEVGLSYTAVSKAITRYEAEGIGALAPRRRGRRKGEDRALSAEQEAKVQRIICDKRPRAVEDGVCFVESCGGQATHCR